MPNIITIKKGLTLNLKGKAEERQLPAAAQGSSYAVVQVTEYSQGIPSCTTRPHLSYA